MGRPQCPERAHFVDVNLTPGKYYSFVMCSYCVEAHNKDPDGAPLPRALTSRKEVMAKHLQSCQFNPLRGVARGSTKRKRDLQADDNPTCTKRAATTVAAWDATKVSTFESLLVEFQADHKLPDTFIAKDSTVRLIEFLCTGASRFSPAPRTLGGRVLDERAALCQAKAETKLKSVQNRTGGRVNLLSDVWMNVAKVHLLGCQLSLLGHTVSYQLAKVGARHDGLALAEQMDGILQKAYRQGWNVGAVVTDNAGQCERARGILILKWPRVIFLYCHAHDINNLVKSVLNRSFCDVAKAAAGAVNALNASSSKWLLRAHEVMDGMYNTHFALYSLCETRWNSMQACFASLLRVRSALQTLAYQYREVGDFPEKARIMSEDKFWCDLAAAEKVIAPLSRASYRLQRDENSVADVVKCFRDIYEGFAKHNTFGFDLVSCVEKRWLNCEQPLFMLGFFLHPLCKESARATALTPISTRAALSDFAVYYYRRLVSEDYGFIRDELRKWLDGEYTSARPTDFQQPVVTFWQHAQDEDQGRKLPQLAIVVLSAVVNTATCERMFSELGAIHSPVRNRMLSEKSRKIQVVRKGVRDRREVDRAQENHRKRIVVATAREKRSPVYRFTPQLSYDSSEESQPDGLVVPLPTEAASNVDGDDQSTQEACDPLLDAEAITDTFSFWQKTLTSIFSDDDVATGYTNCHPPGQTTALEEIDGASELPFPATNSFSYPQERSLRGIRSLKAPLADLFPLVDDESEAPQPIASVDNAGGVFVL